MLGWGLDPLSLVTSVSPTMQRGSAAWCLGGVGHGDGGLPITAAELPLPLTRKAAIGIFGSYTQD